MDELCAQCNHRFGDRCDRCGREFMCGHFGEPCDRDGCDELVMARRYEDVSERAMQQQRAG